MNIGSDAASSATATGTARIAVRAAGCSARAPAAAPGATGSRGAVVRVGVGIGDSCKHRLITSMRRTLVID